MNLLPKMVFAGLLALGSSLALAATSYNFSYTFDNGRSVTGSFSGNASGNLINDLADIHFSLDGIAVTGAIGGYFGPFNPAAPVASFDGSQNQLFFANSDFTSFFGSLDAGSAYGPPGTNTYLAVIDNGTDGVCDSITGQATPPYTCAGLIGDTPRWSVSAVPEPGTSLMLGAGLAVLAWQRRRASVNNASAS
ncbi:PEP-CTERM sorting domain-containing protein [Duganella sp. S19_KUP01_CR8]|uniref:PEP-CTERM sorting domain-containing protein n=1 Tax=Duganella sp. S19_KUP01_CR8 TaxID=3025502 RepID=UPI002FCDB833